MNIEILTDILFPTEEEIDSLLSKIKLGEELDFYDYIILKKIKIGKLIIEAASVKI